MKKNKTEKQKGKLTPNTVLNEVGGAVKIYEALYCSCVHESAYETLSIHRTEQGAEKAVQEHKDKIKKEHEDMNEKYLKHGLEISENDWDVHQGWDISEAELKD